MTIVGGQNKPWPAARPISGYDAQVSGRAGGLFARQYAVLIHTRLRVTARLLRPVGEVGAGGQGVRVLGAGHPLTHPKQRGVLVAGPGRIPRLRRLEPPDAYQDVPRRVRVLDGQLRDIS